MDIASTPRGGFPFLGPRGGFLSLGPSPVSMTSLEMHHPSPHRCVTVVDTTAAVVQQLLDAGMDVVVSNSEIQHALPFGDVLIIVAPPSRSTLDLIRGINDHIQPRRVVFGHGPATTFSLAQHERQFMSLLPNLPLEAGDGGSTSVHSEPITIINNVYEVGDGAVAASGDLTRGIIDHMHPRRLEVGHGSATTFSLAQHERQFMSLLPNLPLEAGDGGSTSVHSEPITIINNVYDVGDGAVTAASGGRRRNGGASVSRLSRGWGGANNPFWMWLQRESSGMWRLLGIGDINILKGGSFALSLIPFFVDKQPPLNARDAIYMRIAFWCGVSAFIIAPLRVPSAESTRLARNRQVIGVITLITGAVIFMVTALDEKLRLLVLFLLFACFLFSLYPEKRESNDNHLLPQ